MIVYEFWFVIAGLRNGYVAKKLAFVGKSRNGFRKLLYLVFDILEMICLGI